MATAGERPVGPAVVTAWQPRTVGPGAADFARRAVTGCGPLTPGRTKNLLWAAAQLGAFVEEVGLELDPAVALTDAVLERFCAIGCRSRSPASPPALFDLEPLSRQARPEEVAAHDRRSAELARYRLGAITATDPDGYHRAMCPAALGKVRCPAKEASLTLGFDRPEVTPPEDLPVCCAQSTITVPPEVNAKTAQKHPYPSAAHRRSYARRTAVERSYSTLKDPASTDTSRGWCRLMGLAATTWVLACAVVVRNLRNLRVLDAFEQRQLDDERRRAAGMPARTRRRRRRMLDDLLAPAAIG